MYLVTRIPSQWGALPKKFGEKSLGCQIAQYYLGKDFAPLSKHWQAFFYDF